MTLEFVCVILFLSLLVAVAATVVKRIKVRTLITGFRVRCRFVDTRQETDELERDVYAFLAEYAPVPRRSVHDLHSIIDDCRHIRLTFTRP